MNVSEDPFYFQYFVGDLALDEFSLLTGKTYLKLKVLYV